MRGKPTLDPDGERSIKKPISIPPKVFREGDERRKRMGYRSFSEYVSFLIQKDITERPEHTLTRSEGAPASTMVEHDMKRVDTAIKGGRIVVGPPPKAEPKQEEKSKKRA